MEHNAVEKAANRKAVLGKFPRPIEDFANTFIAMKKKRHLADYDPLETFTKSQVELEIANSELAIKRYKRAKPRDRRAFAALVLFKTR